MRLIYNHCTNNITQINSLSGAFRPCELNQRLQTSGMFSTLVLKIYCWLMKTTRNCVSLFATNHGTIRLILQGFLGSNGLTSPPKDMKGKPRAGVSEAETLQFTIPVFNYQLIMMFRPYYITF